MIRIKVKPVKGKTKSTVQKDGASKTVKTETEVYASPVVELVKQLKKDALSGDVFPDVAKRIKAAARLLEEYEAYADKLCSSNERIEAELAERKESCDKASVVISRLNKENLILRAKVTELEDKLKGIRLTEPAAVEIDSNMLWYIADRNEIPVDFIYAIHNATNSDFDDETILKYLREVFGYCCSDDELKNAVTEYREAHA